MHMTLFKYKMYSYMLHLYTNTGKQGPFEHEILDVYKRNTRVVFHERAFNYAKALCCLRWISVIKVKSMHTYVRTYVHAQLYI